MIPRTPEQERMDKIFQRVKDHDHAQKTKELRSKLEKEMERRLKDNLKKKK